MQSLFFWPRCWIAGTPDDESVPNKVDIPIVDNFECTDIISSSVSSPKLKISIFELCAGGDPERDTCSVAEAGAPLVCQGTSGFYYVAGVAGWNLKRACADPGDTVSGQISGDVTIRNKAGYHAQFYQNFRVLHPSRHSHMINASIWRRSFRVDTTRFFDGENHQFAPALMHDNHQVPPPGTHEDGYHLTEDLIDHAVDHLTDLRNAHPDKPFFLYLAPGACHSPHQAPQRWLDHYRFPDDLSGLFSDLHRGYAFLIDVGANRYLFRVRDSMKPRLVAEIV